MKRQNCRVPVARRAVLTIAMLAFSSMAWACCPSDGKTSPKAAQGLGESQPSAVDLASDPAWQVYEFERDGIRYLQVNDQAGTVRAAVGRIEEILWVLPVGSDVDRVLQQGDTIPHGSARTLFKSNDIEVVLIEGASGQYWLIRNSEEAY